MPLIFQKKIDKNSTIGFWYITENEDFFLKKVLPFREIKHVQKRLQHLAGRFLLQKICPNLPIHKIEQIENGKPFLPNNEFYFSVSHCNNYVTAIVSPQSHVGIDVEMVSPKITNILNKFLSEQEQLLLPKNNLENLATLCWSVKESVYKWYGKNGLDFIKQMEIKSIEGNKKGKVFCWLKNSKWLAINFIKLNDFYLSWIIE